MTDLYLILRDIPPPDRRATGFKRRLGREPSKLRRTLAVVKPLECFDVPLTDYPGTSMRQLTTRCAAAADDVLGRGSYATEARVDFVRIWRLL